MSITLVGDATISAGAEVAVCGGNDARRQAGKTASAQGAHLDNTEQEQPVRGKFGTDETPACKGLGVMRHQAEAPGASFFFYTR